jgi:hypothetical protein
MLKIRIEICDLQVVAICEIISNKQTRNIEKLIIEISETYKL